MGSWKKFSVLLWVPRGNPDLMAAQITALSRQIPAMYFVLLVNATALVATHWQTAPAYLTLGAFAVLAFACIGRIIRWSKLSDRKLTPDESYRMLRFIVLVAWFLGPAFSAWALALMSYGNAYQQAQVLFFMGVTVMVCIQTFVALPPAALVISAGVLLPMIAYLGLSGILVYQAVAINVAVVGAAMIMVVAILYRDFVALVESRAALTEKVVQTEELNAENERLACLDALTGLPNRRLFFVELERRLEASGNNGQGAVGIIDLDGFKPVNDAFGHAAGDRLLCEVARRLARASAGAFFVARLGGDEFGIIIDASTSRAALEKVGKALCSMLSLPYELPGTVSRISASIGFCLFEDCAHKMECAFERADFALYYAKQRRKGSVAIFDRRLAVEMQEIAHVEQALRRANLQEEIRLVYQPIVEAGNGHVTAFEALARWRSPELGDVMPNLFIRAAERSGQIAEITLVVIRQALEFARELPPAIGMSINLSPHDLMSQTNVDAILARVLESGVAPQRIIFEVTETALVGDVDQARMALQAFRDFGVRIALDDFGTGYSSLSHLRHMPLDRLKIDSSFTSDIENDPNSEGIIRGVFELCRNINVGCIVEGIETQAQLEKIASLGETLAQGYFFSRPLPPESVPDYLAQSNARALRDIARKSSREAGASLPASDSPLSARA